MAAKRFQKSGPMVERIYSNQDGVRKMTADYVSEERMRQIAEDYMNYVEFKKSTVNGRSDE